MLLRPSGAGQRVPRRTRRARTAWIGLLIGACVLAAAGPARAAAQAPYVAQTPPLEALYQDGWANRYLLAGTWLYRADPADQGVSTGLWRSVASTSGWTPVQVPSAFNAGDFSPASMYGSVGWYRKDFLLPAGPRGQGWIVRFESVNYRASVWLNGHLLGRHTGAYLPFELALTHLHAGMNRLIVRVDDRRAPSDIPSGPSGGWWNYGGITREVYLRPVLRADIAQVGVQTLLPCLSATGARRTSRPARGRARHAAACPAVIEEQVLVRNVTGRAQKVLLKGRFGKVPVDFGAAVIAPRGTWTASTAVSLPHPRLWSIYHPVLYPASFALSGADGTPLSRYVTYTGVRTVAVTPQGILTLNGHPLHLRGAFIHETDVALGSALDTAHRQRLIDWMRQLGGHLIRSHYPLHPQLLELADRYGILVWSEIPVNHELSPYLARVAVRRQAELTLSQNILANQNHPSVLTWSIANELALPTTSAEATYIAEATALAHSLDPTRPVTMAISAWPGLACQPAYAPLDALGFNEYFGWFDAGGGTTDDRDELGPFLDQLRACYPTAALLVSEFGFDADRNGPVEERGTYQFQADSVANHLGVFAARPWLAGAVYFTLQDFAAQPLYAGGDPFGQPPFNHKGLVDLYGHPKPAFAQAAAIYRATRQLG